MGLKPLVRFLGILSMVAVPSYCQVVFGARTCLARCGTEATFSERLRGLCSCASSCELDGSCCGDYARFCSKSCNRRCGSPFHPLQACQCHDGCEGDGCCEDYVKICVAGFVPPAPTRSVQSSPRTLALTTTTTPLSKEKGFSFILGREVECPTGVDFVSCPSNPCDFACERHPDAICLVNQCGTCEAKYIDFVGNELDCYDPETYCSDGQRIFDCGDEDLCAGTSCPGFSRAVCVPNKCGGCYYDFVDEKGNIVSCELEQPASACGQGIEMVRCSPLPCVGQICAADITARCQNVMCGECRAEFRNLRGNVVNCNATEPAVCPDKCSRDPCSGAVCKAHPEAECLERRTSTCGECEPSFVLRGKLLRDIDCVIPNECFETSSCEKDPCLMYTCPGRDYICISQYCDGCGALFFNKEGRQLRQEDCYDITTLDLPICPNGKKAQICSADLCLGQRCGWDYSPNCKPDECNNCALLFYDANGTRINCEEELLKPRGELCPDGNIPLECQENLCDELSCPGYPEAVCTPDPCDYCVIRFLDKNKNEVECDEPEELSTTERPKKTVTPRRPRGRCPSGSPFLDCSADLCESVVCEKNPDAICKTNPCDGCKLMFFDSVGRRVNCDPSNKGTCEGRCWQKKNLNDVCQCDHGCARRGDCCADFAQTCETCENRCGNYTAFAACQCTNDCRLKKNCCKDFVNICLATKKCKGACNSPYERREICQCNPSCVKRQNCCSDYIQECA